MKKLEDIPKKQNFEVPEGYFEKLPGIIQSRIAEGHQKTNWQLAYRFSMRFALPAVVLMAAGIFWYSQFHSEKGAESILASVQTEDLIAYLNDSYFTTDELLEDVQLNDQDASEITESVYDVQFSDSEFEEIFNEIDQ